MALICGIEEAGRGPVIGPLVMVGLVIDEKDESLLVEKGVKDSKLLTSKQREALFDFIKSKAKNFSVVIIPPKEIDDAVLSVTGSMNLNWLEAVKTSFMINLLKPDKVIIDCPSPNINLYEGYIKKNLLPEIKNVILIAEHKADVNYPVVSAASILAKVIRDKEIQKIKDKIGIDLGSGYPADPVTKEFLEKYHETHSDIIRHSWAPYRNIVQKKQQKNLFDF